MDWRYDERGAPAPLIERRALAGRRFTARPDDLAELRLVIATMRDVPREAVESWPDMFHLLRRLAGRLDGIAGRVVAHDALPAPKPRVRLAGRPAADHAAIVASVFGKGRALRPARERTRTVTGRKGRPVKVVERPSAQLDLWG